MIHFSSWPGFVPAIHVFLAQVQPRIVAQPRVGGDVRAPDRLPQMAWRDLVFMIGDYSRLCAKTMRRPLMRKLRFSRELRILRTLQKDSWTWLTPSLLRSLPGTLAATECSPNERPWRYRATDRSRLFRCAGRVRGIPPFQAAPPQLRDGRAVRRESSGNRRLTHGQAACAPRCHA